MFVWQVLVVLMFYSWNKVVDCGKCSNKITKTALINIPHGYYLYSCLSIAIEKEKWYRFLTSAQESLRMAVLGRDSFGCPNVVKYLVLREPHPDASSSQKIDATVMKKQGSGNCLMSDTTINIIRCAGGYYIYKFKDTMDDLGCTSWSVLLARDYPSSQTASSPTITPSPLSFKTSSAIHTTDSALLLSHQPVQSTPNIQIVSSSFSPKSSATKASFSTTLLQSFQPSPSLPSVSFIPNPTFSSSMAEESSIPVMTTNVPTTAAPVNQDFEATFIVNLTKLDWDPDLEKASPLKAALVANVTGNVQTFYREDSSFNNVTIGMFREGSVIVDFTINYATLNSIQILKLQEHVTMTGKISTLPAQILNITINKVPNAPTITFASSVRSTSIELHWTSISGAGPAGVTGYLVFYKQTGSRFNTYESVSPSVTQAVISGLRKFTRYTFRVLASSSNGKGVASEPVTLSTDEDVPSVPPSNIEVIVYSSTRIGLVWDAIKDNQANGILLGYNVSLTWRDKIDNQLRIRNTTVQPTGGSPMLLLDDLQIYTKYSFKVCGFTSKGCGPWSKGVTRRTLPDVPSQPSSNLTYTNFTSTSSATIHWDPIPPGHLNGILRGYQVTYKQIIQSELPVEEATAVTKNLSPNSRSLELKDLQAHSIYKVEIAGVNDEGLGAAQTLFIETCRCPKTLYTNFWAYPPYLTHNTSTDVIDGIFPNIVTQMLTWACGVCTNGHGDTILNMTSNGRGMTSLKDSVVGVIEDIEDVPQVSFPIYGNKDIKEYKGSHQYVHVVDSPGIAFITVKQPPEPLVLTRVIWSCLPLIGLIICMTYIAGFVVWLLECRKNKHNFPVRFTEGMREGFWWSFITITTVGYGDRCPISTFGRVFGIFWTLTGLVSLSILLSAFSTSLTTSTVSNDVVLYGTKVAVVENSTEYHIALLKNAIISKDNRYQTVDDIHAALMTADVRGALIDTYVAADQKDRLFDKYIRVKKLLDKKIGYGVVLSGEAKVVQKRCNDFMKRNVEEISKVIQNYTSTLEPSTEQEAVEKSSGLFDSESPLFKIAIHCTLAGLLIAVICGLIWELIRRLHYKVRVTSEHSSALQVSRTKAEMTALVDEFYKGFTAKIITLKTKHHKERVKLIKMKRKMKKNVENIELRDIKKKAWFSS